MKGIYFINDRLSLNGCSKEESIEIQEHAIKKYIKDHRIKVAKINPYQLKEYYTIPHALLYDLRKDKIQYDCFLYYSSEVLEDFIYTYPAKWLILKSFFKKMIQIEDHNQTIQDVI